jgi:hypothetical protein
MLFKYEDTPRAGFIAGSQQLLETMRGTERKKKQNKKKTLRNPEQKLQKHHPSTAVASTRRKGLVLSLRLDMSSPIEEAKTCYGEYWTMGVCGFSSGAHWASY